MNEPQKPGSASLEGTLAEYSSLRDEILKRVELRQALETYALVAAGALFGVGLSYGMTPLVPLMYPPLAFFLALGWSNHDVRIGQIGSYVRSYLESGRYGGPGQLGGQWEHLLSWWHSTHRGWDERSFAAIAPGGVFIFLEVLAVVLGVSQWLSGKRVGDAVLIAIVVLLAADVIALLGTVKALRRRRKAYAKHPNPPNWE